MRNVPKTAVVFVHGLWNTGAESALMRRRIAARHGFECHGFGYRTFLARRAMHDVVADLAAFVDGIDAAQVHFVGHSLGGLVVYRYFEHRPTAKAGRVVLLAAPTVKSLTAERVGRIPFMSTLLGRMITDELVWPQDVRQWRCHCELGLVAGTRPIGMGRFFARFTEDCDGTVAVSETKLPGHKAHLTLPVSHMGMLASSAVAEQVGEFLANGRFSAP